MQNIVTFETAACEPIVFSPNSAPTTAPTTSWVRTLARKWDMIAAIVLMLASAAYEVYALCFLTGF